MASPHKTWVLTGSLDNFRATRERAFRLIGAKEGRRAMAEQIEPGDEIVFYVTGVQAFGGIVRVTSEMFEDREKVWPGKPSLGVSPDGHTPSRSVDPYPWRFETEPVQLLDEDQFVPAVELVGQLEHIAKWPKDHWHLAFQGQLRSVSESDARKLAERIDAARSSAPAPA